MSAVATVVSLAVAGLLHRRGRTAMCVIGVAAGVALTVAVRMQTTSVAQGPQRTERALVGEASIEAVARGPVGMPVSVFGAVRRLASVKAVAPVLVQSVAIEGPNGRRAVLLVGADRRLQQIGSPVAATVGRLLEARDVGLYLPAGVAERLGLAPGDRVTVLGPAGRRETLLSDTPSRLGDGDIGSAPIALAPLGLAQSLTGQTGRLTRLLIRETSHTPADRRALGVAVGRRAALRSPGWESGLLAQASYIYRLSANLFAVMCLLLGAIVVYAVTLLAAVDRRREIATLAALGCAPARLIGVLVCEATMIGAVGGVAGTISGWGLAHALGSLPADHLSFAFPISEQLRLERATAVVGVLGGIAVAIGATLIASARLAFEPPGGVLAMRPEAPRPSRRSVAFRALGVITLLLAGVLTLIAPKLGVVAVCLVIAGVVVVVADVLALLVRLIERALPGPPGAAGLRGLGGPELAGSGTGDRRDRRRGGDRNRRRELNRRQRLAQR